MPKPRLYEIVVPLFNDEENLVNLLNSLIEVGITTTDIIVSMSGPKGNIDELARSYKFRLVYSGTKRTPSSARNAGAEQANADYLVFLDSDVRVTRIWKDALDDITSSKVVSLTGETYDVSSSPNWIELNWFSEIRKRERTYLNGGNIVVKSEIFEALNGFDEGLASGEDYDFSMRAEDLKIGPSFDARLMVHHEGNPKSIWEFFKREKWHAQGDLVSIRHLLKSKPMIISLFYSVLFLVALVFLISGQFLISVLCLVLMSLLCIILTAYKLSWQGIKTIKASAIMNFYLLGRGWALIELLSKATRNLFYRNKI